MKNTWRMPPDISLPSAMPSSPPMSLSRTTTCSLGRATRAAVEVAPGLDDDRVVAGRNTHFSTSTYRLESTSTPSLFGKRLSTRMPRTVACSV